MSATPATARLTVSVVMPVYNAAATLPRSLGSVLSQTHAAVELLLVDDGSTDGSRDIIAAAAADDPRVVPVLLPRNGGVAAARNAGIEAATGRYMAFLDSDDWWSDRKLEVQLRVMQAAGAAVSCMRYQRVAEDGRDLGVVTPPARLDHAAMLRSNHIGNLTGLYDRAIGDGRFRRIGHEDYAFWLDMVRRAGTAVRADEGRPLAHYLVRRGSLSADKLEAARWQWRIYREVEGLGRLASARWFACYAVNALAKRA